MSKRKPNHAEVYMQRVAVRNAIIRMLEAHFSASPAVMAVAADAILTIDPATAYTEMMRSGDELADNGNRVIGAVVEQAQRHPIWERVQR